MRRRSAPADRMLEILMAGPGRHGPSFQRPPRLLVVLLMLAACESSTSPKPGGVASSITLSATNISFSSLLATFDLTATVLDETGTPISGIAVTWATQNAQVATVSNTGRVTGHENGTTQVTASLAGIDASATVNVQQVPFSLTLAPASILLVGALDTATVTATVSDAGGSPIATASLSWTSLDEGVATVSSAGLVAGVASGQTTVTAETGAPGPPLTGSIGVKVGGAVTITTTSLPAGRVGAPYSEALPAVGGDANYVWALISGSLPLGLGLAADGTINGTPGATGSSSFTVEVTSDGHTDTQDLALDILPAISLSTSYLMGGYQGASYSDQIAPATGRDGSYAYAVTAGALPTGFSLASATGAITGVPSTPGVSFFEITASSGGYTSSATYAITTSTAAAGDFNLWISFVGGPLPPPNVMTALDAALARWEQVVIGDVSDETYPPSGLASGICSLFNGAFIEDMVILMGIAALDGPGKKLARAGPCGYKRSTLPAALTGQMVFDEADVATAPVTYLEAVVWHEIAHAMGIGSLWRVLLTGSGTPTPRYLGTNGNNEWTALGGSGRVPVEPNIEAHWDEASLDSEIMTPITEGPSGFMPISRVTIGALLDLGWSADLTAADVYSIPGASVSALKAQSPAKPFDIVIVDPLIPLP